VFPAGTGLAREAIAPRLDARPAPAASPFAPGVARRGDSGLTLPRVMREQKPRYTKEAMQAKIGGTVVLELVVRADGTVGDVRVLRSLDQTYGLDEQAVRAVKEWRFAPGTRDGKPVPVIVEVEMTFTLK
jgi:TonB family protein